MSSAHQWSHGLRSNVWTCERCGARVVAPNAPPPSSRDQCPDRPEAEQRPRTATPAKRPGITDRDGWPAWRLKALLPADCRDVRRAAPANARG